MLRTIRIVVPMLLLVGTVIVNTGNAGRQPRRPSGP